MHIMYNKKIFQEFILDLHVAVARDFPNAERNSKMRDCPRPRELVGAMMLDAGRRLPKLLPISRCGPVIFS